MKNKILNTLIGSLLLSMAAAHAALFQDTFNSTPALDINTEIAARQAGGVISGNYTGSQGWYGVDGTQLVQTGNGGIVLDANLASGIVGNDFSLSFKQTSLNTGSTWSSVYLTSATEATRGNSRLGFHTWGTGQGGTTFTVYGGTGAAGAAYTGTGVTTLQMNALWQANFGSNFDRLAEHLIEFISTEGAGGTNTFDFVVDGVLVLDDKEYAFNDESVRQIEIISTLPASNSDSYQVLYDDLTVIPEPATLGLVGIATVALLGMRRLRI